MIIKKIFNKIRPTSRNVHNAAFVTNGPKPPLTDVSNAAPQLHQTCHPCISQHFRGFIVNVQDFAAVCFTNSFVSFDDDNEPPTT
ncbi:MAG: hypothetical protein OSA51_12470 [Octadecabacter sp.]|nr:hypothetical protein [Octadecabacter sp.]